MIVTRKHLKALWKKAKKVNFTPEGLRVMLIMCNLDPRTMTIEQLHDLWPYINEGNARRFKYGK
jgi:hypothetical protein